MKFNWEKRGASFHADMPGNVTLVASPDRVTNFGTQPKRGTKWHAQVSIWDEKTRTISRYGQDVYMQLCDSYKDAMKLAEGVYLDEQ